MPLPEHSIIFKSAPGITPTLIESALDEPTNLELTGIYNTDSFDHDEVMAGKWNHAEIEIFTACWGDTSLGEFLLGRLKLGEFKDYQTSFTAEGRGLLALLGNEKNTTTSRLCRVEDFGNARCGVDLEGTVEIDSVEYDLQYTLTVSAVTSAYEIVFTRTDDVPDGFFAAGKMTAGVTDNNGDAVSRPIKSSTGEGGASVTVKLWQKMPFPVVVGDTYVLTVGCPRTIEACAQFENAVNFDGEPYTPTLETVQRIQGTI
jgi:uncharacterized phage protein (TIGR02218 family)